MTDDHNVLLLDLTKLKLRTPAITINTITLDCVMNLLLITQNYGILLYYFVVKRINHISLHK